MPTSSDPAASVVVAAAFLTAVGTIWRVIVTMVKQQKALEAVPEVAKRLDEVTHRLEVVEENFRRLQGIFEASGKVAEAIQKLERDTSALRIDLSWVCRLMEREGGLPRGPGAE